MIPNKTEEQILYQQFKFYDLDSSGFCNLQNFIKTNDRLGVVLPKVENFELIFNFFCDSETTRFADDADDALCQTRRGGR